MPSITLFVYGTLKRGGRANYLLAGQEFVGEARTLPRYRLFTRNWYPCLVDDPRGYAIEGELWRVQEPALPALDEFEGAADLFERKPILVEGVAEEIVAYFFLGPVEGLEECGPRWDNEKQMNE
jgi:gamma-glutamylcyclotransferase (GGCT)/AIG2-like uncharacterized protein YtfP